MPLLIALLESFDIFLVYTSYIRPATQRTHILHGHKCHDVDILCADAEDKTWLHTS